MTITTSIGKRAPRVSKISRVLLGLPILLILSGCLRTDLPTQPTPIKVFELAAVNPRPLRLEVTPFPDDSLGHQFLLLMVPFGSIYIPDTAGTVERNLYTNLALQGYKPIINKGTELGLKVTVENIQVTAYDLLVIRRIVSRVKLRGEILNHQGQILRSSTINEEFIYFKTFAFGTQLEHAYSKALDAASKALIKDLRL